MFVAVALFHENDEPVDQLAYSVSAKTINIQNTVLPNNTIVQKSEYVVNDMYNVTRVGKDDRFRTERIEWFSIHLCTHVGTSQDVGTFHEINQWDSRVQNARVSIIYVY